MNKYIYLLFFVLHFNCTKKAVDCHGSKVDLKVQALFDHNNAFYDDEFTGKVIAWRNDEKTEFESVTYYENGQITKIENFDENASLLLVTPIKCNSKHGTVKYFLKDTIVYEVEYFLGRKEGIGKAYHPNGQLHRRVNFKDDKKHGKLTEYSESGEILLEEFYENGEKITPPGRSVHYDPPL